MRPDRATTIETWAINALTLILLRQFKRLLAEKHISLSDLHMQSLGDAVQARDVDLQATAPIRTALEGLIGESIGVLGKWGLGFAQSLQTDMSAMSHLWQSTADFLALANDKGNAEIRISAGSALHTLLGGKMYIQHLMTAIRHDLETHGALDVDAMLCKRAVLHCAHIPNDAPDWWERAQLWANQQHP